jgi:hypothetical protein
MIEHLRRRSTQEVFDDHLALAGEHRFDEDIERTVAQAIHDTVEARPTD